jgi:glycosyltransferase involved in cell wall biosynthesis
MSDEIKDLKIAFLSDLDPRVIRTNSWTATMYYMSQALQRHGAEVHYLGPIQCNERRIGRYIHLISRAILKKNYFFERSILLARKHAKIAASRLAGRSFDVIIAPRGTTEVAYLQTDIPIVLVKDATFALMHNYYPNFSNLLGWSVREGYYLEDLANQKSSMLLYTSEWAARSAIEDFHADAQKVHVVPFGADFESPPKEVAETRKKSDRCRLFFPSVDWGRKGGEIAFETLMKLEEMGIQAELIICGCTPPKTFSHERMTVIPFLDKRDERQRREFENLFETSDFLFLPSRGETYGMVFCEASAFGLPIIATDTGGVSSAVKNGENGFLLPPDARGNEYARVIAEIYRDDQRYNEMVKAGRAAFEERLNWDTWAVSVNKLIAEMLDRKKSVHTPVEILV